MELYLKEYFGKMLLKSQLTPLSLMRNTHLHILSLSLFHVIQNDCCIEHDRHTRIKQKGKLIKRQLESSQLPIHKMVLGLLVGAFCLLWTKSDILLYPVFMLRSAAAGCSLIFANTDKSCIYLLI